MCNTLKQARASEKKGGLLKALSFGTPLVRLTIFGWPCVFLTYAASTLGLDPLTSLIVVLLLRLLFPRSGDVKKLWLQLKT
jgi:hypothetical protein